MVFRIALFSTLFFISSTGFAQIRIGATAGANYNMPAYSMAKNDTLTNPSSYKSFGGHGGLYVSWSFLGKEKPIGVQSDVLISSRTHNTSTIGERVHDSLLNYDRESFAHHQLIYLDLPIHFRYNMNFQKGKFGDRNVLSFLLGAQTSLAISNKYEVEHTYTTSSLNQETIEREVLTKTPYDFVPFEIGLSAGVQFEMGNGFRCGGRYYRSFTNSALDDNLKINSQMLMVFVGYNFATIKIGKW